MQKGSQIKMVKNISFLLNGVSKKIAVDPNEKLLDVLRRNGYKGTKYGCGEGECGTCTVLLNGKPVYACLLYAFQADGQKVETIEGVGTFENPDKIQKALVDEGAVQCGYCIPGMVLSAKAMFEEKQSPNEDDIKMHMDGNLCRCTGYVKILSALQKISDENKKGVK